MTPIDGLAFIGCLLAILVYVITMTTLAGSPVKPLTIPQLQRLAAKHACFLQGATPDSKLWFTDLDPDSHHYKKTFSVPMNVTQIEFEIALEHLRLAAHLENRERSL